jgi:hypothetical protein
MNGSNGVVVERTRLIVGRCWRAGITQLKVQAISDAINSIEA